MILERLTTTNFDLYFSVTFEKPTEVCNNIKKFKVSPTIEMAFVINYPKSWKFDQPFVKVTGTSLR